MLYFSFVYLLHANARQRSEFDAPIVWHQLKSAYGTDRERSIQPHKIVIYTQATRRMQEFI